MTVKELALKYLAAKEKQHKFEKLRLPTILKIRNIFENHIIGQFGHLEITDLSDEIWEDYLLSEAQNQKEVWIYLKSLLKFSQNLGELKKLPDLMPPKESEYKGRALTESEAESLFRAADATASDIGLFTILALLHGARPGEIYKLQWDRIDLDAGEINLRKEDIKTKKPRSFPILTNPYISEHPLETLKKRRQFIDGKYVFPGPGGSGHVSHVWIAKNFRSLVKSAGIENRFTPHGMRHTFHTLSARMLKENPGFSLVDILSMTGITHQVFLKVYFHPEARDLKGLQSVYK